MEKEQLALHIKELVGDYRFALLTRPKICKVGYQEQKDKFWPLKDQKKAIVLGCPNHGNIGDHAITYAEKKLLAEQNLPHIFCNDNIRKLLLCLKKFVSPEDIICLNGGGNMGDLYEIEELIRCTVISMMRKNRIIIFPQTVKYANSTRAQQLLRHSQKVYSSHPDLHLIAREKASFSRMKTYYPSNDILLTPDIVLSLQGMDSADTSQRKNILLCFRQDIEQQLSEQEHSVISQMVDGIGLPIVHTDTFLHTATVPLSVEQGENEVLKKLNEFRQAKLVITDRIHGMIFSAITGTPCIALDNSTGKVKDEYEWLQKLPYILYADSVQEMVDKIPALLKLKHTRFPFEDFAPYFAKIKALLTKNKGAM